MSAMFEATYQPHSKDALERKFDNSDTQDDCQIKDVWIYEESFGKVLELVKKMANLLGEGAFNRRLASINKSAKIEEGAIGSFTS